MDIAVNTENQNSKELIGRGIRAYVVEEFSAAVAAFSKAAELLVTEYGDDLNDNLADIYLYYGKSLLNLSREECEPLGDAVPKDPNGSDDDEEVDNDASSPSSETKKGTEKEEAEVQTSGMEIGGGEQVNKGESSERAQGDPSSSSSKAGESSEAIDGTEEKVSDEDPTDLQVAWEVLELAKIIYQRQGEKGKRNLAETFVVLGEISLESENFQAAITDIQEGLKIQKELFGEDSRTLAETFYKLGVAYSTVSQMDKAIQNFEASLQHLNNRISNLEKLKDQNEEVTEEIAELKNLIPEVQEKIADMKSYKQEVCQCDIRTTIKNLVDKPTFGRVYTETVNKLEVKRKTTIEAALKNTLQEIFSAIEAKSPANTSSSSPELKAKPPTDISHLVKRKRKLDEIVEEGENENEESLPKKSSV